MQQDNHSNRNFRHWTVVALVVSTLILVPFLTTAQEATPEDANAEQEAVPEPTPTPIPPTSEPTPTPISPTPTPEPTPTPVSPTQVSEPTPTPEQTPASDPSTPAPEPSPDVEPTATPTSTPDDEPANTLECDTEAQTKIEPGGTAELHCAYTALTDGNGATVTAAFEEDPGEGWFLAINDAEQGPTAVWVAAEPVDAGQKVDLVVIVHVPHDVEPGYSIKVLVSSSNGIDSNAVWSVSVPDNAVSRDLSTTRVVEGDLCFQQVPTPPDDTVFYSDTPSAGVHYVRFQCYAVQETAESEVVRAISVTPGGWRYRISSNFDSDWIDGKDFPQRVDVFTHQFGNYTLDFGPTEDGMSFLGQIQISVTVDGVLTRNTTLIAHNGNAESPDCTPSVTATNLNFGQSTWQGAAYEPKGATLDMTISQNTNCTSIPDGWSIQISSNGMSRNGGDGTIAASDITYLGSSPGITGLTPVASDQPLATTGDGSTKIADGSVAVISGTVWSAQFRLQPPASAPPGNYSGTITITVTSAGS